MNDEKEINHAFARSRSNDRLGAAMVNEPTLPRDMEKIFEAPDGSRLLLLLCHQGQLLALLSLERNQTRTADQMTDIANCRIGLFGLAMTVLLLGLHSTPGQAKAYLRNLFHRRRKQCPRS